MKQIILLLRVSTERQEIELQKKELIELAKTDGYTQSQMVIIEGVGASAIKLNDLYLQQMDELYKTIEEGDIEACYAWEISRIGRDEVILMKFKNFLIEHKVQLVVKNPSLRLLNNDGSVNNGIELAFGLFATMSKQEMQIKKERFARTKARNKAEGKFNGGRIKLGYKLTKDKYFEIDDEKAEVVRNVFQLYLDGKSKYAIMQKLIEIGIYNQVSRIGHVGDGNVHYLLTDICYTGENGYPQIIDKDTFDKVRERLSNRRKTHRSKNVFYGKSLVIDVETGARMTARASSTQYVVPVKGVYYTVPLNMIEYIAEYSTNIILADHNREEMEKNLVEYGLKIEENEKAIKVHRDAIKTYKQAIDRAIDMNIARPQYYPTERLEQTIKTNEKAIKIEENIIIDLQAEITNMKNYLNGEATFINSIKGFSDEKKSEFIHNTLKAIKVKGLKTNTIDVEVENKIGYPSTLKFQIIRNGRFGKLYQFWDGVEQPFDLTQAQRKHKRFTRIEKKKPS